MQRDDDRRARRNRLFHPRADRADRAGAGADQRRAQPFRAGGRSGVPGRRDGDRDAADPRHLRRHPVGDDPRGHPADRNEDGRLRPGAVGDARRDRDTGRAAEGYSGVAGFRGDRGQPLAHRGAELAPRCRRRARHRRGGDAHHRFRRGRIGGAAAERRGRQADRDPRTTARARGCAEPRRRRAITRR